MIGGTLGWTRRALALLLAFGAGVLALTFGPAAPASAATLAVTVDITGIAVAGTEPTDLVTLTGTITNTGDVPAYGVQVYLWRSMDPIRDLAALRQTSTNAAGWGTQMPQRPGPYLLVTNSVTAFTPGASAPITLQATLADLGFNTRGAAYAIGAQVLATDDMSSDYQTVGQFRTVVALPAADPVPVTSIVLLSATPTKLVENLFRNDDLAAELSGRLDVLLTAAAQPGMSWLIDPGLLDEVRDLADGYQVGTGTKAGEGAGAAVAAAWLARFATLDPQAGGRTLYANPDVNGARVAADASVVPRAQAAAAAVEGVDDLPLIVVPGGRTLNQSTYAFLADSGANAILASNSAKAGALKRGTAEPLVLTTSALPTTGTDVARTALQQVQETLSGAVVAGQSGVARLLSDEAEVAQDAAAMTGWMQRRRLGDLLTSEPSGAIKLTSTKPARLSKAQFGAIDRLAEDFETYTELVPTTTLTEGAQAALSRTAASAFIGRTDAFDSQARGLADLVSRPAISRSVTLDASPRFLMSARSNEFPVTVTNKLAEPIRVKVVVKTENPQRLTVPASQLFTVPPDQSVTVNIKPQATANGLIMANAHVATESGGRVTPDTAIVVEVTDLGVVAWIIVGVSAVVLVGATAWRIRQVRRRDSAQQASAAAEVPAPDTNEQPTASGRTVGKDA
ncbi:MAG TPA: hypothetical protein PLL50_08960 [Propionicimonas sp.]|nr:hypothetical protein [Propionicimonas sp.]HQA78468.1 hypothetical protein [Propionicimonas sp.]HQD97762.1 hypothetical protein [Propionicimonas sp.]